MLNVTSTETGFVIFRFGTHNEALSFWTKTILKDQKSISSAAINDNLIRVYPEDKASYFAKFRDHGLYS